MTEIELPTPIDDGIKTRIAWRCWVLGLLMGFGAAWWVKPAPVPTSTQMWFEGGAADHEGEVLCVINDDGSRPRMYWMRAGNLCE